VAIFELSLCGSMSCGITQCVLNCIQEGIKEALQFDAVAIYAVFQKNVPLCDCPYLRQILTDFQSFSTVTFCGQIAVVWLLKFPAYLNFIAALPCET